MDEDDLLVTYIVCNLSGRHFFLPIGPTKTHWAHPPDILIYLLHPLQDCGFLHQSIRELLVIFLVLTKTNKDLSLKMALLLFKTFFIKTNTLLHVFESIFEVLFLNSD